MQFTLKITEMGGAQFEQEGHCFVVADILETAAQRIREGHMDAGILRDVNGNRVGQYRTTDEEDSE